MTTTSVQAGYKMTEIGVIPEDWEVKKMNYISDVRDGTHDSPKYVKQGIKFVTSKNIIDGKLDFSEISYISKADAIEVDKRSKVDEGDILMSMIGTIGNAVLIDFKPDFSIKNVALIKPFSQKGESKYLIQLLHSPYYQNYILGKLDGGIQKFISLGMLRDLDVPLPPTTIEQQAIATVLSDTDELIRSLSALIAKKRQIKEGAMQELLTGKKRLAGFSGEWEVKKLGEVANFYDNLRVPITESKRESGTTPYYGANGIQGYIKGHTHDGEFVLIAEDGANDLSNYPVLYVSGKVWVNNHAHVIQGMKGKVDTKYLSYALKTVNFVQVLVGGTRAKLNGSVAKLIQIIIPNDIVEQQAIAEILSDMDSEITALEQKCEKYRLIKQGMMQQLLTGKIRLVTK